MTGKAKAPPAPDKGTRVKMARTRSATKADVRTPFLLPRYTPACPRNAKANPRMMSSVPGQLNSGSEVMNRIQILATTPKAAPAAKLARSTKGAEVRPRIEMIAP
jgi:hypothetical protein